MFNVQLLTSLVGEIGFGMECGNDFGCARELYILEAEAFVSAGV